MTTTETAARFTLDEDRARAWIGRAIAANPSAGDLPDIGAGYRASDGDWAYATAQLVDLAQADGIIADAQPAGTPALAWEFIPTDGQHNAAHRWILNTGPGTVDDRSELITVTYPAADDMWGMGLGPDSREIAGAQAALAVLTMAVQIGNDLDERLRDYVAALPLAVRAPEVGRLLEKVRALAPEWEAGNLIDAAGAVCDAMRELQHQIDAG